MTRTKTAAAPSPLSVIEDHLMSEAGLMLEHVSALVEAVHVLRAARTGTPKPSVSGPRPKNPGVGRGTDGRFASMPARLDAGAARTPPGR